MKAFNLLNIVAVKNQSFEVDVVFSVFNLVNEVARVVNVLEVGRGIEVESPADLVPGRVELNHVLEVRQVLQIDQFVV